jgi:putative membrane protein
MFDRPFIDVGPLLAQEPGSGYVFRRIGTMKRWTHLTVALAAAVSMAACAGDADPYDNDVATDTTQERQDQIPGATTTANADRGFVEDMLTSSAKEIEVSQLAQQKATNPQVKQYAQELITDHQQATQSLRQVASQANIQVTPDTEALQDAREELSDLAGEEFDRAYIEMMVDDHQQAVNWAEDKSGDDATPEVQQWATKQLPALREHLDKARQLQETLDE